ncbi:MAG: aldehyde dehydrogenase family protein [Armatimonadetes bacterium]|nr:aldehyde dehydrogenase family protein [Armatimonadota bacterium]
MLGAPRPYSFPGSAEGTPQTVLNTPAAIATESRNTGMTVQTFKFTYATMGMGNQDAFHDAFQKSLETERAAFGKTHGHWIDDREVAGPGTFEDRSPIDRDLLIGHFATSTPDIVKDAIAAARRAWPGWRDTPWPERVAVLRRAAERISEEKYDLAALMSLEMGKNRLEAMGDVEESADLIRYYVQQMEDAKGFEQRLGSLTDNENTRSVLRPFGVFAVICPFNFPLALAAGPSAGALVAGNTVVFKPSSDAPGMGLRLAKIFHAAGIPRGAFNVVTGAGQTFGDAITAPDGVDGFLFTGSKETGMHLMHQFSKAFPRPAILELGGKNPAIVMESADLDKAAEGIMKSAFGMGGQKCSACSRAYVHEAVYDKFIDLLVEKTRKIKIGDPTERDVYLGPIVNQAAVDRYQEWVEQARQDGGRIAHGGKPLTDGNRARGCYVEPTVVTDLPLDHPLFYTEIFAPVLAVGKVRSLDEAIALSNKAEYGLTAGIFTEKKEELDKFFNEIESGVLYANRRTGATTGAWPGVQSFCGWKGSGSTGKGGCGPYYVMQFMREQSRTVMT